ncbi:unnamed protein product [Miscanthus lutarioriparius]|uniref:GAG-pre-integrase domain-containing protein n=1 Tax=Miscanthus lutarioriparius TaxID=422564 RepID=A0A811N9H2_9POAL|nr:unnamed protein product [Miscanthus lutarioriparius]
MPAPSFLMDLAVRRRDASSLYMWIPRRCCIWSTRTNRTRGTGGRTTTQLHGTAATCTTTPSSFRCTYVSSGFHDWYSPYVYVMHKDKLNGTNYADWIRNLRIVLRAEKKEDILDTPLPVEPTDNAPAAEKNAYKKACDADLEMQFDNNHAAYDMIVALNDMFQTQARNERFNVSKAFVETKLAEGAAVGPHVIKMVGYTQRLEKLGFPIGPELATDFILASLPPSYGNFISNYHMHGAEKGLNELCGMLKTVEADIKKGAGSSHVMAVQNKPRFKKKGNSWKKKKGKAKGENSKPNPPAPKAGPTADTECYHCKGKGHWKRNYKLYLESMKDSSGKGHISENRMKRLHADGLLTSFDFESYETCEACLLGKMTKAPFIGFP